MTNKIRSAKADILFYVIVYFFLTVLLIIVLYPLTHLLASSFSDATAVSRGEVTIWPVRPSLKGYTTVFAYPGIWRSYLNTVFYTVAGTAVNVFMTVLCAYPLARKTLPLRGMIMALFTFTMLFIGGLIPNYILMMNLKIINTVWVMILPGAIGVTNMIITRTFIQSTIPGDLLEASQIDGCTDLRYLVSVVLPLSKAVLAVITLYYAVGHWNNYFTAIL